MNDLAAAVEPVWKRYLTPWKIAVVMVGVFLITEAYLMWRDRAIEAALRNAPAFATPALKLEFSSKIPYDPLSFVGRGAHAGFWNWTPQGLELTAEGSKYFRVDGDQIISNSPAGSRRLTRIQSRSPQGDGQRIEFFYEWVEISPAADALLRPAPKTGEEYLASAALARRGAGWEMTTLETRDFDEPLQRLQDAAGGIRR